LAILWGSIFRPPLLHTFSSGSVDIRFLFGNSAAKFTNVRP
jgi:hypothetical protein